MFELFQCVRLRPPHTAPHHYTIAPHHTTAPHRTSFETIMLRTNIRPLLISMILSGCQV